MKKFLGWWRWVLTDVNDSWDLSILLWLYAVGLFLYKATTAPPPFDFTNFGIGTAGVFVAGKSLEWLTERHKKDDINVPPTS